MRYYTLSTIAMALVVWSLAITLSAMDSTRCFISGYGPVVRCFDLTAEGDLRLLSVSEAGKHPSFIALHPTLPVLYAINEVGTGTVTAFSIADTDGTLKSLGSTTTGGKGPCYVSVSPDGRWLLTANYGSGHAALIPLNDLGIPSEPSCIVEAGINAHMAITDPSGRFVYVPCKGSDYIAQYRLNADTKQLEPLNPATVATAAGSGPRHITFTADGLRVYGINELDNTVSSYTRDAVSGLLTTGPTISTLPTGSTVHSTGGHLALSHDEKTLFASNRGQDDIVIFALAPDGTPTAISRTKPSDQLQTPRHFALTPNGDYLLAASQKRDTVLRYRVASDGQLTLLGETAVAGKPCSIVFQVLK